LWGTRDLALGNPEDLDKLIHQVLFGVETPGGVHKKGVTAAGTSGGDGVKDNSTGICALLVADEVTSGALCPNLNLFSGGRTKSIGRSEKDFAPLPAPAGREFTGGGGLARAVHTGQEDDARLSLWWVRRHG
jgi:hypothetical protein